MLGLARGASTPQPPSGCLLRLALTLAILATSYLEHSTIGRHPTPTSLRDRLRHRRDYRHLDLRQRVAQLPDPATQLPLQTLVHLRGIHFRKIGGRWVLVGEGEWTT